MEWTFARRYLTAKKSHSVINLIAAVSSVAVGIPVAAMVILMSVFNGFESLVKNMYEAVDADLCVSFRDGSLDTGDIPSYISAIENIEGVLSASDIVEGEAILSFADRNVLCPIRGIGTSYTQILPIKDHIYTGSWLDTDEDTQILLGETVAGELGIYVPKVTQLDISSIGGGSVGSVLPLSVFDTERLTVQGIFRIDEQSDRRCALVAKPLAERLFGSSILNRSILVSLRSDSYVKGVKQRIREIFGENAEAVSREERNSAFYAVMKYEKWGVFFVSLLVLLIAALSAVGTIVILVMEKRKERGTLRSMGADTSFIRRIFIREGMLITGIGCAAGVLVGISFVLAQQRFGLISMPEGAFVVDTYPVELRFWDTLAILLTVAVTIRAVSQTAVRITIKRENGEENV